jgi:hypothetical protein
LIPPQFVRERELLLVMACDACSGQCVGTAWPVAGEPGSENIMLQQYLKRDGPSKKVI